MSNEGTIDDQGKSHIWVVQGYYQPYGWEDLTAEETYPEALKRKKEFIDNEGGKYRIKVYIDPETNTDC